MGTRKTFGNKFLKCDCYYCVAFPDDDEIKELKRTLINSGREMFKVFYYPTIWGIKRTPDKERWHRCRKEYTINIYQNFSEDEIKQAFTDADADIKKQDSEENAMSTGSTNQTDSNTNQ